MVSLKTHGFMQFSKMVKLCIFFFKDNQKKKKKFWRKHSLSLEIIYKEN